MPEEEINKIIGEAFRKVFGDVADTHVDISLRFMRLGKDILVATLGTDHNVEKIAKQYGLKGKITGIGEVTNMKKISRSQGLVNLSVRNCWKKGTTEWFHEQITNDLFLSLSKVLFDANKNTVFFKNGKLIAEPSK